jgi:hypothetical protein
VWNIVLKKKSDGTPYILVTTNSSEDERRSFLELLGNMFFNLLSIISGGNPETDPFGVDLESKTRTTCTTTIL